MIKKAQGNSKSPKNRTFKDKIVNSLFHKKSESIKTEKQNYKENNDRDYFDNESSVVQFNAGISKRSFIIAPESTVNEKKHMKNN